jgi:hypothetical protein
MNCDGNKKAEIMEFTGGIVILSNQPGVVVVQ